MFVHNSLEVAIDKAHDLAIMAEQKNRSIRRAGASLDLLPTHHYVVELIDGGCGVLNFKNLQRAQRVCSDVRVIYSTLTGMLGRPSLRSGLIPTED